MYIRSIGIDNFSCFEKASAEFHYPGRTDFSGEAARIEPLPNINLIVGDNGSGKTSLLKAVALAVLGSVLPDAGFRPYFLVRARDRSGVDECRISALAEVHEVEEGFPLGSPPNSWGDFRAVIERRGTENRFIHDQCGLYPSNDSMIDVTAMNYLASPNNPFFFLCGYGSNRRAESTSSYDEGARTKARSVRYQRVAGLFEESFSLTSFSAWFQRSSSNGWKAHVHFDYIVGKVEELLQWSGVQLSHAIVDGEAEFQLPDGLHVPFLALSDGYRAFLAWVGDLLRHLADATPPDKDPGRMRGVVLVDEVDLHLHPAWQKRVLESLSSAFPNLQFIVTTHSPILVGSVPTRNIHVVERADRGGAKIYRPQADVYGQEVNSILYSDFFGQESTLPPSLEDRDRRQRHHREDLARTYLKTRDPRDAEKYFQSVDFDTHRQ